MNETLQPKLLEERVWFWHHLRRIAVAILVVVVAIGGVAVSQLEVKGDDSGAILIAGGVLALAVSAALIPLAGVRRGELFMDVTDVTPLPTSEESGAVFTSIYVPIHCDHARLRVFVQDHVEPRLPLEIKLHDFLPYRRPDLYRILPQHMALGRRTEQVFVLRSRGAYELHIKRQSGNGSKEAEYHIQAQEITTPFKDFMQAALAGITIAAVLLVEGFSLHVSTVGAMEQRSLDREQDSIQDEVPPGEVGEDRAEDRHPLPKPVKGTDAPSP